jgi:hypothetical protein
VVRYRAGRVTVAFEGSSRLLELDVRAQAEGESPPVTIIRREVPRIALSKPEAAESLGMSVRHFERHVQPHIPVVYSGGLRLFPLESLRDWANHEAQMPGRRAS